jgi:hypothetical protein
MSARYSESTLRILKAAAASCSPRTEDPVELGILKYLVDCVAAMKEVFALSDVEDRQSLQQLASPFINQIGCVLKECYLETSLISRSRISRQATSCHILAKFPDLGIQTITEPTLHLPLIHFAVYNCQEASLVRSLVSIDPSMLQLTDGRGALPLHWAAIAPPAITLRQKSELYSFLLEQCPTCVLQEDDEGLLPLHWAVNQDSPDLNLICQLVELAPDSVSRPSARGLLPLHLAVNRSQPVVEVVLYLLECYPEGIQDPCRLGWLPLHYCVNRCDINLSVLKLLLDRYPEAVNFRSDLGQLPLHRLLDRAAPAKRAAKLLIQTDPASLKAPDNDGFLPLHTLLSASEPPASSLVKLMVHSCFPSVRQRTGDGWLPIHLAMKLSEHVHTTASVTATAGHEEEEDNHVKRFLDTQQQSPQHQGAGQQSGALALQRVVAILQELLSVFPESLDEFVVELQPSSSKKIRWTPMSYALSQGKHSTLARALRPFRKKVPLSPAPPADSHGNPSANLILPALHSPLRHASTTGDLEDGTRAGTGAGVGYQTPLRSQHRPNSSASSSAPSPRDTPLIHFSALASSQSPISPALAASSGAQRAGGGHGNVKVGLGMSLGSARKRDSPGGTSPSPPPELRQESFSDLV